MNLSTLRETISGALEELGANVYAYTPQTPILPAVVIVPDEPYIEIKFTNKNVLQANFQLQIAVSSVDNLAGIQALEELSLGAIAALPAGIIVGNVSAPNSFSIGQAEVIAVTLPIQIPFTQE